MFKPDGGIFVTIAQTKWSLEFGGVYPYNVLSPNDVTPPGDLQDSDAFPLWSTVYHNGDGKNGQ